MLLKPPSDVQYRRAGVAAIGPPAFHRPDWPPTDTLPHRAIHHHPFYYTT
jgi:hypothetical protein